MVAEGGIPLPAKGSPAAAIAFVVLLCAAVAAAFVFRGKIFKSTGGPTNQVATASDGKQTGAPAPPEPAVVAPPANDTNWMLNLGAAVIPDATAAGRIHGRNFICERAILDGGTLTLRMPARDPTDLGLSIYLYTNKTAGLGGQAVSITTNATNAPRVRLRWREDQQKNNKTKIFTRAMRCKSSSASLRETGCRGKCIYARPTMRKATWPELSTLKSANPDRRGNPATAVVRLLAGRRQTLALAESCTGGCIAHHVTNVPGASAVFLGGVVAYSNAAKQKFLGVRAKTLARHGAVSEAVAREMAEGAREKFGADFALAVTGIAGPAGGTKAKPVGTVFIALAGAPGTVVERKLNPCGREQFKDLTAQQTLEMLRARLVRD